MSRESKPAQRSSRLANVQPHPPSSQPVRDAFLPNSTLHSSVCDGLQAMRNHSAMVDETLRREFADSLDLDAALLDEHPTDHRWDYLVGHSPTARVVGIEVHSANTSEVTVVIAIKQAARDQLRPHLRDGKGVDRWVWVASGNIALQPFDKHIARLAQNGIVFAGKTLRPTHLK